MLNERELATILGALRYVQNRVANWQNAEGIYDVATNCGTLRPLEGAEIDALCEKLNAPPPRVIVEVTGGVAEVTDNPGGVTVDIIDHDNLDDGESDITDERPTQHGEG